MKNKNIKIRRALISVYDKTNIVKFAEGLEQLGIEIISTGGTADLLCKNNIKVKKIDEITRFPEILDGRVKTLHPNIYAGLLSRLDHVDDKKIITQYEINEIDLVVVNLYPFQKIMESTCSIEKIIENIDIGGPSMIRASAKNYERVSIITDTSLYKVSLEEIKSTGGLRLETRVQLAAAAFRLTSIYDQIISNWFDKKFDNVSLVDIPVKKSKEITLRYGENPHQSARLLLQSDTGLGGFEQFQGKELSFNNINDIDAALQLIADFKEEEPTCAIIKHTNPCGVAQSEDIKSAYLLALSCDPTSAFGGIIICNCKIDEAAAKEILKTFSEVVIAPDFTPKAKNIFLKKKNLRIIKYNKIFSQKIDKNISKSVFGGVLIQDRDTSTISKNNLRTVTKKSPTNKQEDDLLFAFKVAKHVKSNAIVYAKNKKTIGIGAGQMSRIDSSKIAIQKFMDSNQKSSENKNCVMASDAFFPFADGLELAINFGVSAVIQPGGSIRDDEVIKAANDANISMVFTNIRNFKH